ncbi:MAG: MOSC domain-containing protein [Solirubrobacteraceae bacterium]|jgi:MOSC domain-containing protein YiiM
MTGRVEAINIAADLEGECRPVEVVEALAGQGLLGDRYFADTRREQGEGRDITLIQAEALEGLHEEHGIELSGAESRRNVLTRGIDLNALVGRRFTVGEAECVGIELCEPCNHLQKMTQPGVLRGLVHRGGLRADVVRDGRIAVGDAVQPG